MNKKSFFKSLFSCVQALIMVLCTVLGTNGLQTVTVRAENNYSAVFDAEYYYSHYSDVAGAFGNNPAALLEHFKNYGMSEGRQGNAEFNVDAYMANYEDLRNVFGNNLKAYYEHYMNYGKAEGRKGVSASNSTLNINDYKAVFDAGFYYDHNSDVAGVFGKNADALLKHFVNYGMAEGRQGSSEFDVDYYRSTYGDLESVFGGNLKAYYEHYMSFGRNEGRKGSAGGSSTPASISYKSVFNSKFYCEKNKDVAEVFGSNYKALLDHFVNYGMAEGRQGSAEFDVNYYRNTYKDLESVFGGNLKAYYEHYINFGKAEGRWGNAEGFIDDSNADEDNADNNNEDNNSADNNNTDNNNTDNNNTDNNTNDNNDKNEDEIDYSQVIYDYSFVFDARYYYNRYPELQKALGNNANKLFEHFLYFGMAEGRQGNAEFDVQIYMNNYPELKAMYGNDLKKYYDHYRSTGRTEGKVADRNILGWDREEPRYGTPGGCYLKADNKGDLRLVVDGNFNYDYTGMFNDNSRGWCYIKVGVFQSNYTGLVEDDTTMWYVKNGVLDRTYTDGLAGVGSDMDQIYYVVNGRADYDYNGFFGSSLICIRAGKWDRNYTGLWHDSRIGWWYLQNGNIDRSFNGKGRGFYRTNGKIWAIDYGRVATEYTGVWYDENMGYLYVENGIVNNSYTGLARDYSSSYDHDYFDPSKYDALCLVINGVMNTEYTGVWNDDKLGMGQVQLVNGKCNGSFTGFMQTDAGFVFVENGTPNYGLNGKVYEPSSGTYVFVKNGYLTDWNNYIYEDIIFAKNKGYDYSYESEEVNVFIKHESVDRCNYWLAHVFVKDPNKVGTAMANGGIGNGAQTTSSFASSVGAIFAVNGSQFDGNYMPHPGDLAVVQNGHVLRPGLVANMSCYTYSGAFVNEEVWAPGVTSDEVARQHNIKDTLTFGPTLINNGQDQNIDPSTYRASELYYRSVVGMVKPGHYVFLVTDGGRGGSTGMTLFTARDIMKANQCTYAYNLDAGGSATMTFRGQLVNIPAWESEGERRVIQFLYVMP